MKCAYRYALAEKDWKEEGNRLLVWLDCSSAMYLRQVLGYGKQRLAKYMQQSYDLYQKHIAKYSDEKGDDRENLMDAGAAMEYKLKLDGIIIRDYEKECYFNYQLYMVENPKLRATWKARVAYINASIDIARFFYTATILWLHQDKGFGADRCRKIYCELRQLYNTYCRYFLQCTPERDTFLRQWIRNDRKALDDLGITLQYHWEDGDD